MKLHSEIFGEGQPLIILHGLYGSGENWLSHGKELAKAYEVHLIDQRNHGRSPHADEHNYAAMELDLLEYYDDHQIERSIIIGHSMGGKTAMFFAVSNPERLSALIVVDMAPNAYNQVEDAKGLFHKKIFDGLKSINLLELKNRTDADIQLRPYIPYERVRKFLLKNLERDTESRHFKWKLNLNVLYNSLENVLEGLDPDMTAPISAFPVLFIRGELSGYITDNDIPVIREIFPYAEIETVEDTGHWLHAEKPQEFLSLIHNFLN